MKTDKIRRKSLNEMIDEHIGIKGTKEKDVFEEELRLDVLGQTIRKIREEKNLTQEQLGKLVGVKKALLTWAKTAPTYG